MNGIQFERNLKLHINTLFITLAKNMQNMQMHTHTETHTDTHHIMYIRP